MTMTTEHFKALKDCQLLLWEKSCADDYAERYAKAVEKGGTFPSNAPMQVFAKEGQEVSVTYGDRAVLVTGILGADKEFHVIASVAVTLKVGAKSFSGMSLAYDEQIPSIVVDPHALRPMKKRSK